MPFRQISITTGVLMTGVSVCARRVGESQAPEARAAEQSRARGWARVVVVAGAVRLARRPAGAAKILDPSVGEDRLESWVVHVSASVPMVCGGVPLFRGR